MFFFCGADLSCKLVASWKQSLTYFLEKNFCNTTVPEEGRALSGHKLVFLCHNIDVPVPSQKCSQAVFVVNMFILISLVFLIDNVVCRIYAKFQYFLELPGYGCRV